MCNIFFFICVVNWILKNLQKIESAKGGKTQKIVSMLTDCLTDRLGLEPILSVSVNLTVAGRKRGESRYM